eukprot:CAMPEP_0181323522 /NCGR_PEP_ID=MMETSP1101-20121128/19838_1 /TAXON_ID=46948 /ORGANISM="Rhodomonas abbreviata, Strain Caron Lab Isolate" /LENGTH=122 /DNA_ID=CAMNT_0023431571 /DNA_START=51 /DNA_END=419 /DNA_ORIENTATION=+
MSTPAKPATAGSTPVPAKPATAGSTPVPAALSMKCTCCALSCGVCGNKNSKLFHVAGCGHFTREVAGAKTDIGESNQVCFKDFAAALAAGYKPCKNSEGKGGANAAVAKPMPAGTPTLPAKK